MNRKKYLLFLWVLLLNFILADSTLVRYFITGINAGPPVKTLTINSDGTAELIIDSFFTSDTLSHVLDSAELGDLTALFDQNNWDALDTVYMIGCLSCPEFSISYDSKTVRGNTPAANTDLNAILTGLNDLVSELQAPTGINSTPGNIKIIDKSSSLLPWLFINFKGRTTQYGILKIEDGRCRIYDLHGRPIGHYSLNIK